MIFAIFGASWISEPIHSWTYPIEHLMVGLSLEGLDIHSKTRPWFAHTKSVMICHFT